MNNRSKALHRSFKSLITFIFLFAIVEKTGMELVSFIEWQLTYVEPAEAIEYAEKSQREAEHKESKLPHETWIVDDYLRAPLIYPNIFSNHKHYLNILIFENFFPTVPTPPPNLIIV